MMRKANLIVSVFLFFGSVGMFFFFIPWQVKFTSPGHLSPQFWPKILMVFLMILSLILFFKSYLKDKGSEHTLSLKKFTMIRVFALPIMVLLYTYFLDFLGYIVATVIGLAVFMFYFGLREVKIIIPTSFGITLLLYYFFEKILKIVLPGGVFF